jgi:hypothetical protein
MTAASFHPSLLPTVLVITHGIAFFFGLIVHSLDIRPKPYRKWRRRRNYTKKGCR